MSSSQPKTAGSNNQKPDELQNKETFGMDEQAQGADSGFLSGPQSSFCDDQDEVAQHFEEKKSNINNLNFPTSNNESSAHNPNKGKDQELYVLDSGCIEEYEEEEYDDSKHTDAKVEVQSNKQQSTLQDKPYNTNPNNTNMRLTHDTNETQIADGSRNNFNASSRATGTTKTTPTTTTKSSESNQLPAWEQCYQQNDEGDTYLHLACLSGHENVVAALIRLAIHPCLLNIKNDYGQTPLHLTALTKQRRILRMLLLAGAEPSIRDRHGNTALHLACMSGDEQCVNALTMPFSASEINEAHRQYGYRSNDKLVSSLSYACLPPNMEIRNYNGEYCVHIAAEAGHLNILSILTRYGADINAKEGKGGYTPLHIAIETGNEELFKFLIDECKHKLSLETETFGRLTAYQFACILKRSHMKSLLENRGAKPLTPPDSEYETSDDDSDLEDTKNYDRFVDSNYFGNYKGANAMAVM